MINHLIAAPLLFGTCLQNQFFPPNDLRFPLGEKNHGLSEEQYHAVIDKFESHYAPIVKAHGAELKIDRKWESPTVNAGTFRDERGKHWHINLYGGFARHPLITEDGFALVICHEIGHHLGGAPKKVNVETATWASAEGQADYFATLKCLREIFEKDDNLEIIKDREVPEEVSQVCRETFYDREERALCVRSSLAGYSVGLINSRLQGVPFPSFATPDLREVEETNERHPHAQCRLDTYFAGAVCEVSHAIPLSQTDEVKGTCHPELDHEMGTRPLCWYRPQ